MTVLLTRPAEDNARIADELDARGIPSMTWPLSRIAIVPGSVDIPDDAQAVIFTSANAVRALSAGTSVPELPAICVGKRTSRTARDAGFARIVDADGASEDLVALVRDLPMRRFVYLRAETVSRDLAHELQSDGCTIHERIVYRAAPGAAPDSEVKAALVDGRISVVTIWSRQNATALERHLTDNPYWNINGADLVAISQNAAKPLGMAGFRRILAAARPTAEEMVDAIGAALRQ